MAERPKRADARRNYDAILAAAEAEVARTGADASLEKIARDAGVGSATLHRHFPTRQALLEAVFHDRVVAVCDEARALSASADPGEALTDWIRSAAVFGATTRGVAEAMLASGQGVTTASTCETMLREAGDTLMARAVDSGAVRPGIRTEDLLTIANAVSLATHDATDAARLITLALDGVRP